MSAANRMSVAAAEPSEVSAEAGTWLASLKAPVRLAVGSLQSTPRIFTCLPTSAGDEPAASDFPGAGLRTRNALPRTCPCAYGAARGPAVIPAEPEEPAEVAE